MRHGATLTVGYDGSRSATRALAWAVGAAAGHAATVQVIACFGPPPTAEPWFGVAEPDVSTMAADAECQLLAAVGALRDRPADVGIHHRVTFGLPAQRLAEEALQSELLVVGTSGHATFDSWRLGSVAHAVVRHAPCPVVLVPDVEPPSTRHRIVVGVDGSAASAAAIQWACDEADDRDAELSVVHVRDYPCATELGSSTTRDLTQVDAALALEAAVRAARDRRRGLVEDVLVRGSPTTELIARSDGADLVVLGTRGRSGVRATLFGSVSQAVSANAACPTVVVHAAARL